MDILETSFSEWFAERLKELRNNEGMTQKEFSEACGISSATYERHEQGRFCPRISTCILISKQLGINLSALFNGYDIHEDHAQ